MTAEKVKPYLPPAFYVLRDNLAMWGNPLGMGGNECASWAKGLEIPSRGESILYTGCEYQMATYVESLVELLKKVKFMDSSYSVFKSFATVARRIGLNPLTVWGRAVGEERKRGDYLVRQAALTLRKLGVNFACLDAEPYSGALIHELGFAEDFKRHAQKVTTRFKEAGAKRIITLSPHSTESFLQVYPQVIDSFDFEVTPFVTVVAEALQKAGTKLALSHPLTVTLHDPCRQARCLKVVEQPRVVLRSIRNLHIVEAARSKEMTYCCGAPIETTYPELAQLVARRRVEQLYSTGAEAAITMCPFCYSSLRKAAEVTETKFKIVDFIEIVYLVLEGVHA
jgi:Fe-S oxidoreductase